MDSQVPVPSLHKYMGRRERAPQTPLSFISLRIHIATSARQLGADDLQSINHSS